MKISCFHHHRLVWMFIVIFVSLSLVGVALAAANLSGRSITPIEAPLVQAPTQAGQGQPAWIKDHAPLPPFTNPPQVYPKGDPVGEQMRQQAMAASQGSQPLQMGIRPGSQSDIFRLEFWVNPSNSTSIWGNTEPNIAITITTSSGDVLYAMSDELGDFSMDHPTPLDPGDTVEVIAGSGGIPLTVTIPDIWADSDSTTDTVSGRTGFAGITVEIYPNWEGMITTLTDAEGNFTASFTDVPPQGRGYIRFLVEQGPANTQVIFHHTFYDLQPAMAVNYAHDWVEGNYDPGYQVWITVTNQTGEVKATAQGETGNIPYWGSETGFATHYNVFWDGPQPDIQEWDHVYLRLSNDRTHELQVGEISGEINTDADVINGSLYAPWLADPVQMTCSTWIEDGASAYLELGEIDTDHGAYSCDFASVSYDLLPGMDVGVDYYEPDGDRVVNVFKEPAPHLWINIEPMGKPAFGNNYILRIHYNNDGQAIAQGVNIVQYLYGLSYISDTSGVTPVVEGNTITWDLGDKSPYFWGDHWFDVFLHVDDNISVSSSVDIDTSVPYYQNDRLSKHDDWAAPIFTNDSQLSINKGAWTWTPVPGQEFVYNISVCNSGVTASSEVLITDTLPLSTTLMSWFAQDPGWVAIVEDPHQLVVSRPSFSGASCGEVFINVLLDELAQPGLNLHNEAWVWADSDIDPNNNFIAIDHQVGYPWYNLHLESNWVFGSFIPGGQVIFEANLTNWGNMPMPNTQLFATIPDGTEFLGAYGFDWSGSYPLTPTVVGDDYVMWDFDTDPNGFFKGVGLQLKINDETQPGTPLVVEYRATSGLLEERYDDNVITYTELVNPYGPNLRVDKHTNWWWYDWWEGDQHRQRLNYELRITNLGSEYLENVVITDTYPADTTFYSCWWGHNPGERHDCEVDPPNHQVIFRLDYMNPGDSASAMFDLDLVPEVVDVQGLEFFNEADISNYGDIVPQDNHDEVTAFTGPDVFVRKWLKEGELRPGELVTYTVEMGNLNKWPWLPHAEDGSYITDTLPAGMTFVRAVGYWGLGTPFGPESIVGQQVVWKWSPMWPNSAWTFDLVVKINEGVAAGTELLNTIEAWSDNPDDIDPNPLNNHFAYSIYTTLYQFMLPIAQRSH